MTVNPGVYQRERNQLPEIHLPENYLPKKLISRNILSHKLVQAQALDYAVVANVVWM